MFWSQVYGATVVPHRVKESPAYIREHESGDTYESHVVQLIDSSQFEISSSWAVITASYRLKVAMMLSTERV
jgi:hypothetical protein